MTALRTLFDRPIFADRTLRELLLVGGALAVTVHALAHGGLGGNVGNVFVYVAFGVALWFRFYAARALLVALVFGALAQILPNARAHFAPLSYLASHSWRFVLCGLGLLLLCSRDLVARYDRAPSRHRWFPNFWATLDARDARWLRWCGYALSVCIGASVSVWRASVTPPSWLLAAIIALSVAAALLCMGRAVILLLLPLLSLSVVLLYASYLGPAEAQLSSRYFGEAATRVIGAPGHVLPAMVAVAAAGLLALPYAVRVMRRARQGVV